MRLIRLVAFAGLSLLAAGASANELDLNLSNDTVRARFVQDLPGPGVRANFHYLYHQDHGHLGGLGLHVVDDAGPARGALDVGVGGNTYFLEGNDEFDEVSGGALGVGGHFRYTWPTHNRIGLGGHAYYAPQVVSFDDIQDLVDLGVRAEYLILRRAGIYLGYRYVKIDIEDVSNEDEFDSGLHLGLRLEF